MSYPKLIVMLTHHDKTVTNAFEIFDQCKSSQAQYWGFKEIGLSLTQMKELFSYMKSQGKTTVLEVVAYTEEECISGAKIAAECNCDILMGTLFFDSVNDFCQQNHICYMPFVGTITGRPSILTGTAEEMISEAVTLRQKGVFGFDLLGYRYTGNASKLNQAFVSGVNAPTCLAGSVNSYERLDEIKSISPWAFTIGGAFFENKFGDNFFDQINNVCEYIKK